MEIETVDNWMIGACPNSERVGMEFEFKRKNY
jgi:hypothetical protein